MTDSIPSEQRFEVGEVAIIARSVHFPELVGREVTITQSLHFRWIDANAQREWVYETDLMHAGFRICPAPYQLRKKRPPQERTTWSEVQKVCGWKPNQVTA